MILDNILVLCNNASIASATSSANYHSSASNMNILQMDQVRRMLLNNASAKYDFSVQAVAAFNDMGRAGDAVLHVNVGATQLRANTSACTLTVKLGNKSAAASFKSASVSMEVGTTPSISATAASNVALFAPGKPLFLTSIPADVWGTASAQAFIGLLFSTSAASILSGTITAWIGPREATNVGL